MIPDLQPEIIETYTQALDSILHFKAETKELNSQEIEEQIDNLNCRVSALYLLAMKSANIIYPSNC